MVVTGVQRPMLCLSFDVEEHFQVVAFDSPMRRRHWDRFESRVEQTTSKILEILAQCQVHATFFVLGWLAERHGALIQRISEEGHEVASHGYANEIVTAQTPRQFREDVRKTKAILEDLTGQPVLGYRAPNFTFTDDTLWALPILVEEGYRYDSSILPSSATRNTRASAGDGLHRIFTASGPLWELPPRTIRGAGVCMRISGGGWFRLLPYPIFRRAVMSRRGASPVILFFRAWEFDPKQPRMSGSRLSQFRHYNNLHKTEAHVRRLLHDFHFFQIRDAIASLKESPRGSMGTVLVGSSGRQETRPLAGTSEFKS